MTPRRKTKPRPARPALAPVEAISRLQADIEGAQAALATATGLRRRQLIGEIDVAEWTIARLENASRT